jgi:hypothetical protein
VTVTVDEPGQINGIIEPAAAVARIAESICGTRLQTGRLLTYCINKLLSGLNV